MLRLQKFLTIKLYYGESWLSFATVYKHPIVKGLCRCFCVCAERVIVGFFMTSFSDRNFSSSVFNSVWVCVCRHLWWYTSVLSRSYVKRDCLYIYKYLASGHQFKNLFRFLFCGFTDCLININCCFVSLPSMFWSFVFTCGSYSSLKPNFVSPVLGIKGTGRFFCFG